MQEILLYGGIYSYTAEDFITKMNDLQGENITCRINCQGGDVFAGWGMIAKASEHTGGLTIKVDGIAASMAAFMLLFADNVECLDVSSFVFHRADGYVQTEEDKAWLASINANFRKKMESKIPASVWRKVTGKSYDDLFNPESRIDCMLTAKQAKELGLVSKINKISVAEAKNVKALADKYNFTAELPTAITAALETEVTTVQPLEPQKMKTVAELMAAHPDLVAQIQAEAVTAERDRVGSFMAFSEIDPVAVKAGIESGKPMSQTQMSEFSLKAIQAKTLGTLPNTPTPVAAAPETAATEKTEAEKKQAAFLAEASEGLAKSTTQYNDINFAQVSVS
jgi:ATP-dependent protease ClpP protease subunit